MKSLQCLLFFCLGASSLFGQTTADVPCTDDADADRLPGKYYDHTQPKYPMNLGAYSAPDKAAMTRQLIAIEKLEEASRNGFSLTGCVIRTSFNASPRTFFGAYSYASYGYQLGVYQNVCHVQQHVLKTVGEYRTVLRVEVNPSLSQGRFYSEGGDFYVTDKSVRYDIPVNATYDKLNSGWLANHPGIRLSQFVSAERVFNSQEGFDKFNTGAGYVEEVMQGSDPKKYQWLNRNWYVTRPGVPLLVPVTRREYLEALLEYYEVEKANFTQSLTWKVQENARRTGDDARKKQVIYDNDKAAYQAVYQSKKAKVSQLIASSSADWLQKTAVLSSDHSLRPNDYNQASGGLLNFEKFYDDEKQNTALYQFNPAYFREKTSSPTAPVFLRVQFRYERGRGYSERLFDNFTRNYAWDGLRKMVAAAP